MPDVNLQFDKVKGGTKTLTVTQLVEAVEKNRVIRNRTELLIKSGDDLLKVATNVVPS